MRFLVTGACGFVGSALAQALLRDFDGAVVYGLDNLIRRGSEMNRSRPGVVFLHGDIRSASDFEGLPKVDWVIDAAANPSVLAGLGAAMTSRQVLEHNLAGLINVLEFCKRCGAGLVLLSSSRVFSIRALAGLPLRVEDDAFRLNGSRPLPPGVSERGIARGFSTDAPVSLYGSTKLASEAVALEYGMAFGFPVWVDRCGVLAGAGQFGTPEQGIFAYWIHAHRRRCALRYVGFGGTGHQVRDALHPHDLAALIGAQVRCGRDDGERIYTAGGGAANAISLAQLTAWCDDRFGPHAPGCEPGPRPYDIPWMVMDNDDAGRDFGWRPALPLAGILDEIATHAECRQDWLEISGA
jgi:CDP-paratose 2-epimerase